MSPRQHRMFRVGDNVFWNYGKEITFSGTIVAVVLAGESVDDVADLMCAQHEAVRASRRTGRIARARRYVILGAARGRNRGQRIYTPHGVRLHFACKQEARPPDMATSADVLRCEHCGRGASCRRYVQTAVACTRFVRIKHTATVAQKAAAAAIAKCGHRGWKNIAGIAVVTVDVDGNVGMDSDVMSYAGTVKTDLLDGLQMLVSNM